MGVHSGLLSFRTQYSCGNSGLTALPLSDEQDLLNKVLRSHCQLRTPVVPRQKPSSPPPRPSPVHDARWRSIASRSLAPGHLATSLNGEIPQDAMQAPTFGLRTPYPTWARAAICGANTVPRLWYHGFSSWSVKRWRGGPQSGPISTYQSTSARYSMVSHVYFNPWEDDDVSARRGESS
jgi:hypothetical protein